MTKSKISSLALGLWLPIALTAILLTGFSYWSVQQNYRLSANDPQAQMATEAIKDLSQVDDLSLIGGSLGQTDITQTSNPFLVVYDDTGKPVVGNGYLNGELPQLPAGAFAAARKMPDNRFTWQPKTGQRFAAVLKHYTGKQNGFILTARSLSETDKKISLLTKGAGVALLLVLIVSYIWSLMLAKWMQKNFASHDHTHEHHTA
jgi:hypothetical protein